MKQEHIVCTVIAPNYLSQALVLGQSLVREMPKVAFRILILQDNPEISTMDEILVSEEYLQGQSVDHGFLNIHAINWEDFDLLGAVNKYDLLEFATSVKPALIRYLLKSGWKRVTYLDPDIKVFEDFSKLLSDVEPISLTPHILKDFPMDGRLPNQQSILYAGTFNLGFISCTDKALDFLDWWAWKLEDYCTVEVQDGYHVDQKWVDWAPVFSETQILRHPGLNVAYWNLHERSIQDDNDKHLVLNYFGVNLLYFFHFSGFNDFKNLNLSKHSTRIFSESIIPMQFIANYANERLRWQKYIENSSWKLRFEVNNWTLGGRARGEANPLELRKSMITYNRKQLGVSDKSKRNLKAYRNSQIGRNSFAGPAIGWLIEHEFSRKQILRLASGEKKLDLGKSFIDEDSKLGIEAALNYLNFAPRLKLVGYFAAPTGVGQIARNTAALLKAAGIRFVAESVDTPFDSQDLTREFLNSYDSPSGSEDLVLAFINADMWLVDGISTGKVDRNKQFISAVWAWEIDSIPSHFKPIAQNIDQVYALSTFSAQALQESIGKAVRSFPTYCSEMNFPISEGVSRSRLMEEFPGLPEKYILCRFDAKSVLKRKNPESVIEVWKKLHSEFPDMYLVFKTIDLNSFVTPELLRKILNSPQTIIFEGEVTDEINKSLMAHASVYISLHRAEGLGLNILEAIFADVPAVFTNYSGLALELQEIGYRVDFDMTQIGGDAHPYPPMGDWAEPNIESAISQLRLAIEDLNDGTWKRSQNLREIWIKQFLTQSTDLVLKEIDNLIGSIQNVENRFERFTDKKNFISRKVLPKIKISFLMPFWKILPVRLRQQLKPKILDIYFRILKSDSNPTFRQ